MSAAARLAVWLVLAIQLAGGSVPCPIAPHPERGPDHGALAEPSAQPCPMHADAGDPPATWVDALCPCGCESGAPPSSASARTGPALLVAPLVVAIASPLDAAIAAPLAPAVRAPARPDHVPLAIA